MVEKASILGVATEWEQSAEVRRRILESGSIFVSESGGGLPSLTVKGASINRAALLPLAGRLADGQGTVNMVTIPDLISENLGSTIIIFCLCVTYHIVFDTDYWAVIIEFEAI